MALSFEEVTALWKADKRKWVKVSSYATYIQHVNNHILPYFSGMDIEAMNDDTVQEFADSLLGSGLRLKSIKDVIVVLKMILRYGSKLGAWPYKGYNLRFPTSAETRRNISVLSQKDQQKLQRYLSENFSFRNLGLQLCLQSGMRVGEICALQWQDFDLQNNVIHITKTTQRIWLSDGEEKDYRLSVGSPKTMSSVRDIPIARGLLKTIKSLRKVMRDDYYVVSNAPQPLEPRYYRDYLRKVLRSLGITPVRFHALRHTFATRCIEQKCDYKAVSVLLGHASISTTMDLYVHPGVSEKRKVIEKVSRLMGD